MGTMELGMQSRTRNLCIMVRLSGIDRNIAMHTHTEDLDSPIAHIRGMHILVVDDNIQAADSLAMLLSKVGAPAGALYSGEEVLSHDLSSYQILLIDVGMPHIDGHQVVKTLRERGVTVPIIALTGHSMPEDVQAAMDAGYSAHLTKPIGLKELTEAIIALT